MVIELFKKYDITQNSKYDQNTCLPTTTETRILRSNE